MLETKNYKNTSKTLINKPVFIGSSALILFVGLILVFYPTASEAWMARAQLWVAAAFGWYYVLIMAFSLVIALWLAFSRFGKLKLGAPNEDPEFSYHSWLAMLFSAGIGIALVYYGAYEPLAHFLTPPEGQGGDINAARHAMVITFLHWGVHGWSLYALIATTFAWFAYRRGHPLALRSALYPLFGQRIDSILGHLVDSFGILVTIISMVTNLGIGALLINSGLSYLFDIPQSTPVLIAIIVVMMVAATIATVIGIDRGIALLSNVNVLFLCILLLVVFLAGPSLTILDGLVQNTGDYISSIIKSSFNLYLFSSNSQWLASWTLFYWAWWIAWAPFVGLFIARISRGRTIKELVLGVMLIPLGFTLLWLSLFGNTAIDLVLNHGQTALGQAALENPPMAIYKLFEYFPYTKILAGFTVVISFVLFLTPVDSGTLMIANLSSKGGAIRDDAPHWIRVFWGCVTTLICVGLLYAGSFSAMQTAVVLCGLPFSIVILLYMLSLCHDLIKAEKDSS
ncbi:BCCT family transporter [Bartonella sp. DGB2]|uniref:BCCT family transporter n=1 Tax=Bartonella sp. DGB2 TaxID=3388426 RepID=UPI00398FD1A3